MNRIKKAVSLLNRQGVLVFTSLMVTGMLVSLAFFIREMDYANMLFMLIFGMVACWNISDAYKNDSIFSLKKALADAKDKLCLSEHKAERLTSELETTQAALLEAKRLKNTIKQKAAPIAVETSTEEVPVKEIAPKSKRKTAPRGTKKPKTKNENKD